jgi:DNA repair protein RecN (Recombination protein N)
MGTVLAELRIENLGVIAELSLVLRPGLTALTGETGAGKSMLLGAVELLLGGRADATLVRPGAAEARVEGRFVVGDDEMVLARVVPAEGRSRAYVDGRLATVATLAEVAGPLVDLHGQHTHQSLLHTAAQREALDRAGRIDDGAYRAARRRIADAEAALTALGGDARTRARELDLLRFQVEEIEAARIAGVEEDSELASIEELLAGALAHKAAAVAAVAALVDDGGALDGARSALAALGSRGPLAAHAERLRGLVAELDDLSDELRTAGERIEDDPARLDGVRTRRQLLRDLRRKYGDTLADVLAERDALSVRIDELERHDERVRELEDERAAGRRQLAAEAAALGSARRAAAGPLAEAAVEHLRRLALPKARLEVVVGDDPGDQVTFLLGANPGEPALPLAKVASGGELARTMLALRLVLADAPPTLVFDEVDAGIGGEAALAVGRSLASLAAGRQVLVVTHLAQVAAFADHQVVVSKAERDGRTVATAALVEGDERARELTRMLSGLTASAPARQHAEELLALAAAVRVERVTPG